MFVIEYARCCKLSVSDEAGAPADRGATKRVQTTCSSDDRTATIT